MAARPAVRSSDAARSGSRGAQGPVGVIDIGSNSVRLAIFESRSRSPVSLFNEKVLCGLGRSIASSGKLDGEGVDSALQTLRRFELVLKQRQVAVVEAFATAAVRDAKNGTDFIRRAEKICGVPIRVLSGVEEARLAVLGVACGIPHVTGLVGDLGGGSFELSFVNDGEIEVGETLPLGALRLMDHAQGDMTKARAYVDEQLSSLKWLLNAPAPRLYAVGGAWRALARLHMSETNYGLRILHHYTMRREHLMDLAKVIANSSRKHLEQLSEVPARRIESLPYSALVMERLLALSKVKEVVVSAYGVREGILLSSLTADEFAADPLKLGLDLLKSRFSRDPQTGEAIARWAEPFFGDLRIEETERQKQLRHEAIGLSDIAWADHPDHRASLGFRSVLYANIGGIDHPERLFLAACVFYRYAGGLLPEIGGHLPPVTPEDLARSRIIGTLARLAIVLSGSVPALLDDVKLALKDSVLTLEVHNRLSALDGDAVRKRLRGLADAIKAFPGLSVADCAIIVK